MSVRGTAERACLVLVASVLLAACETGTGGGDSPPGAAGSLAGTVVYRERIALPADATVEVRLEDVSRADAPAVVIADQTIAARGRQVPIPFELAFAPARIEPGHRYGLRAAIRAASGDLLFTTATHHPVLERGAPTRDVEVLVERVRAGASATAGTGGGPPDAAAESGSTGSIVGGVWRLVAIARPGPAVERVAREPVYTLELGADGRYGGQAHCNRYLGGYERPAPGRIAFKAGATTLAACPPPSIADEFLRAVAAATRYVVRGNELELSVERGTVLTFARDASQASAAPEVGRTLVYDCDGGASFTVRTGPGEVALWTPESVGGQYVVLGQTPSASGARYADGPTVFWSRGESARIEIAGRTFDDCRSNPRAAPWAEAKRRGAVLRALGNEPAWELEIFADRLALVTDLGANRTELPYSAPVVEGTPTTYRAAGGDVVAVIARTPCTDSMSGEVLEATATVTFRGTTLRGCGRDL